jgi:hypothetical protein
MPPDCTHYIIHSREGLTQGAPESMIIYGLTMSPLAATVWKKAPTGALSMEYADDDFIITKAIDMPPIMQILLDKGPSCGFYVEPEKSYCICHDKSGSTLFTLTATAYLVGGLVTTLPMMHGSNPRLSISKLLLVL